jgi:hypothetical protein
MADTPNYGFYKHPRFSTNHVADYITTDTAPQREGVIRNAKFPRKPAVVAYKESRQIIRHFLADNSPDPDAIDDDIRRLEARCRREPEGWSQDELRRNVTCLQRFKATYAAARLHRYNFLPGPQSVTMKRSGVTIHANLDLLLTETAKDGTTYSGGCVIFLAGTDGSRKRIEDRRKMVAALINWALEESNPNIEVLPRLCLSLDVFGGVCTPGPTAISRLRHNVEKSCAEAARAWDDIEPPNGYDGPDWR